MRHLTLSLLLAALALQGCAELNSIHRSAGTPPQAEGKVVTVDAKQRHLLMMPERSETAETKWRVCAEAAPDVFSAFATSMGAQGNKDGGQFSLASAETAATIERTQTINLLRESFYRTCERYASGAINRTQFVIQAARDQRAMIAVLAVEQLTGAVRPKSTIISGPGTAAATLNGAEAAKLVRELFMGLRDARQMLAAARAAQERESAACSKEDANKELCNQLAQDVKDAEKAVADAQQEYEEGQQFAKDLVTATTASTLTGMNLQGGEIGASGINGANLAAVAFAVVEIQRNAAVDESLMFCIGVLSDPDQLRSVVAALPKGVASQATLERFGAASANNEYIVSNCMKVVVARANDDLTAGSGSGLKIDDMVPYRSGFEAASGYLGFKAGLLALVERTSDSEVATRIARFESELGTSFGLGRYCPTQFRCMGWFYKPGNDPYLDEFHANPQRASAALGRWTEPLPQPQPEPPQPQPQ